MAIIYDEVNKIFNLQTKNTSYIMGVVYDKYLVHIHYGKRLNYTASASDMLGFSVNRGGSISPFDYGNEGLGNICLDTLPQEYATYGSDLREPAFHAKFEDGTSYTKLLYKGYKIYKGKEPIKGLPSVYTEAGDKAESIEIELYDDVKKLTVILKYTVLDDFDAISRHVTVINNSDENVKLKKVMSTAIDFNNADYNFTTLNGSWARERHIQRVPLHKGVQGVDSKRGASGHRHNPFIMLSSLDATEDYGEAYGFSLVYSGNFEATAEVEYNCVTRVLMGINSFDFSWLLAPGESFDSPEVIMVYSGSGIGEMSRNYHKLYRTRLCRGKYRDSVRPVLINVWEAVYFTCNEEKILAIAEKAKDVGIELLVLDDGWFGKRDSDNCSLGDWVVYKEKLPSGIDGLAKKINDIGLKFGLWFEPEMISPDSDLYRAHPDWCIHIPERGRGLGRQQLILDLSRDEVCDYIIESVAKVLSSANISYVKWDMNRNMSEIGNEVLPRERQRELPHRYMLGLYRVLQALTSRFPDILFEGCAGGGGRFDPGMLYYFPQIWASDDSDAIERLYIQEGTALVYPVSTAGAHVSAVPNHQVGRTTPLHTRGNVAMTGQFGYELDLTKLSEDELNTIKNQVATYKSFGTKITEANLYRLRSSFYGNITAWEFLSEERDFAVVMVANKLGIPSAPNEFIKLKNLVPDAEYKERATGKVYRGEFLEAVGMAYAPSRDFNSVMLVFEKI
ncbi:MAG: alpha-galactosidase [Clostridia bacterium]|nr:alpha-galactosidase [Clostridia bacterium]